METIQEKSSDSIASEPGDPPSIQSSEKSSNNLGASESKASESGVSSSEPDGLNKVSEGPSTTPDLDIVSENPDSRVENSLDEGIVDSEDLQGDNSLKEDTVDSKDSQVGNSLNKAIVDPGNLEERNNSVDSEVFQDAINVEAGLLVDLSEESSKNSEDTAITEGVLNFPSFEESEKTGNSEKESKVENPPENAVSKSSDSEVQEHGLDSNCSEFSSSTMHGISGCEEKPQPSLLISKDSEEPQEHSTTTIPKDSEVLEKLSVEELSSPSTTVTSNDPGDLRKSSIEEPPRPPTVTSQFSDDLRRPSIASSVSMEKQSVTLELNSEVSEVNSLSDESSINSPQNFYGMPCSSTSDFSSPLSILSTRSVSPPANNAPPIPIKNTVKDTTKDTAREKVVVGNIRDEEKELNSNFSEDSLPRLVQELKISLLQFKPYQGLLSCPESRVSIQVRLDDDEIIETAAVGGNPIRIFSETVTVNLQRQSQYVKLVFVEHMPDSGTRKIGKVAVRRRDIIPINGTEVSLPVQGSMNSRSLISAILGEICLDIRQKENNPDIVQMKVLDYTATLSLPARRPSNISVSSSSSNSSGPHLAYCNGKVYLQVCVTAHGEPLGPMSKVRLQDRRALDHVEFDCKAFKEKCINMKSRHSSSGSGSSNDKQNKDGNGNLKSSSGIQVADSMSPVRLNIRIYSDPSYEESSYVGFVRIPLDSETFMPIEKTVGSNWYEIKSRMTISQNTTVIQQPSSPNTTSQYDSLDNMPSTSTTTTTTTTMNTNIVHPPNMPSEKVGDLRIRFWYSVEHILSLHHYQPLHQALISSLDSHPYDASLASILQHLPVELGLVAKPLMKIFLYNGKFDELFRLVCRQYLIQGRETSTLFRNQSMASKLMHEVMKFLGIEYLISTLKPVIDLVYAEKKKCEIDPTKIRQGENIEENIRNLTVYAELAFVRVCESANQCPQELKNVFAVLRSVVNEFYPEKIEMSRLAVSSFLIMRFFSAAILNPTQYGLKKRAPDPDVARTLVLISKILQRLANCVVSSHPLTTKEPWLSRVLERFFNDEDHRNFMTTFFDAVSIPEYQFPSTSGNQKQEVLKSGLMVERRGGTSRRRSIKDFISQKRRFVTLTEKELSWQKIKDSQGESEQKGVIPLSEITSVTQVQDSKTSFRVSTPHQEVHFQANNNGDMTDWMILLITLQRRNLFFHNRSSLQMNNGRSIDVEKELENLHSLIIQNIEKILEWRETVENYDVKQENLGSADKFPQICLQKMKSPEDKLILKNSTSKTISDTLSAVKSIEDIHHTAMALAIQMQNLQNCKSEKLGMNGLTDNENYLLMHGRERHLKTKGI